LSEQCGVPELADENAAYQFLGVTIDKLPPDPRWPTLPRRRLSVSIAELERRRWERISRPKIEARQSYIIDRLFSGRTTGIWPLIEKLCWTCNSQERLWALLPVLNALDKLAVGQLFWRTMRLAWSACDATGHQQRGLLKLLRRQHTHAPARRHDNKGPITVYRGSERSRAKGISWSRSRAVAIKFARGLRGDTAGDRVVATARAPRRAVFMYLNDRNEREVLLDPQQLANLTVQPYDYPAAAEHS
jgi:hypothetical protein